MDNNQQLIDPKVGQVAEGRSFSFLDESRIDTAALKFFEFDSPDQLITTENREFCAVCPFSGLPDIATLIVTYRPRGLRCMELKALKYYLTSFRNVGIYQEGATKRIYNDLKELLQTDSLVVTTIYNTRGGFDTTSKEGQL